MNKILYILSICFVASAWMLISCDESVDNVVPSTEKFDVGTVRWNNVTDNQKAVITELLNSMVKVEANHFYMGGQSKTSTRANYTLGYTASKDTIWKSSIAPLQDSVYINGIKKGYAVVYFQNGLAVGPVIEVSMKDYFIGKYEITQGQWDAVMDGVAPTGTYCKVEALKGTAAWYDQIGKGKDVAAYNISYDDAVAFCEKLNSKTGLKFRLPTEAEWECAARGGRATHGYKYSGSDSFSEVAWCYSNACAQGINGINYGVHEGGQRMPNELGIYDMCGNVSEWVQNSYYMYQRSDSICPQGAIGGDTLILRGGSWVQQKSLDFAISSRKKFIKSSYSDQSFLDAIANCGFRIVLD